MPTMTKNRMPHVIATVIGYARKENRTLDTNEVKEIVSLISLEMMSKLMGMGQNENKTTVIFDTSSEKHLKELESAFLADSHENIMDGHVDTITYELTSEGKQLYRYLSKRATRKLAEFIPRH